MLLQWKVFEPSLSEIQFVVPNTGISICIYTLHCNCNNTNATEKAQIKNDQINFGKKFHLADWAQKAFDEGFLAP